MKISAASRHHPLHSRRRELHIPFGANRLLAVLEGIEGGFAIGASIIVALSFAGLSRDILLMTAVISIIVSGFNSASVKYSSEHYLDELDGREKNSPFRHYLLPATAEFVCYVALSIFAILPLLVLDSIHVAVVISITITLIMLFVAGFWRGYVLRMNRLRDGLETAALGGGIILVGLLSGLIINSLS